jgi:Right handed beta helix region/Periplasmic copper-binding protein (NosD)
MINARRLWIGLVVLVLAAFVLLARWYAPRRLQPALTAQSFTLQVVSGADHGAGSLREALFTADTAAGPASIRIRVAKITLESALPPLVNPHGMRIGAADGIGPGGVSIDAHAVSAATPVFDVDAAGAVISNLAISGCPGTAILVRAAHFTLSGSTISSCDVGVEIATGSGRIALENNRLQSDRIGVRFTAPSPDTELVKNEFDANDSGLWMVASQAPAGSATGGSFGVHDNRFVADRTGIVVGNLPVLIEQNEFDTVHEAAVHVVGADAVIRRNRISTGGASGIVVENASGTIIQDNELDHLQGYAILLRGSSDALISGNRIQSCAYGMAFVLGDPRRPDTAVNNTLLDLNYDGIDIIGDSPVLRANHVLQARVMPLHVVDFSPPHGAKVPSHPLLENNDLQPGAAEQALRGAKRARP